MNWDLCGFGASHSDESTARREGLEASAEPESSDTAELIAGSTSNKMSELQDVLSGEVDDDLQPSTTPQDQ